MTSNATIAELERLWNAFYSTAQDADDEAQEYGGLPTTETTAKLDRLNHKMVELEEQVKRANNPGKLFPALPADTARFTMNGVEYEYQRGTYAHFRLLKVLRSGIGRMSEDERELVKLAPDEWLDAHEGKAMSMQDAVTGGFLADDEFTNAILATLAGASSARQVARVIPVGPSIGALIPVRAAPVTAKRTNETATRAATDEQFKLERVPLHEMQALVKVSHALLADASYDLSQELVDGFAQAARVLEAREFIKGSGNGEMAGLDIAALPSGNVVTCADSSGHLVAADDVCKLVYETLSADYLPGARLVLHPKMLSKLRMLKATSGNTYLMGSDAPGTLFGFPYQLMGDVDDNATPAAGKKVAYLVNPVAYAIVVQGSVVVQRLTQPYAEQGLIGFAIYQPTGGQVVLPDGVARLVTA